MDIENTNGTACVECNTPSTLVKLTDALDKLGVEYTIEQRIAA